jgi:hypothetical protein
MPEKVTTIDDTLEIYQEPSLDSTVITKVPSGVELQLGATTVIEGREWVEAVLDGNRGYVIGPNARGHTNLSEEFKLTPPDERKSETRSTNEQEQGANQAKKSGGIPIGIIAAAAFGWFLMGNRDQLGQSGWFIIVIGAIAVAFTSASLFKKQQ